MAELPGDLLSIAEVAQTLRVSTKTVRRMVARGNLVIRRFNRNTVRVDGSSVMRLLAGSMSSAAEEPRTMTDTDAPKPGEPRLLRQRGRAKVWTAWIDFKEVPLGTTDKDEAEQKLKAIVGTTRRPVANDDAAQATGSQAKRPYRVYPTDDGRFIIKYYDADGIRRSHSIPTDMPVKVETPTDAEAYAARWYEREVLSKRQQRSEARASQLALDFPPAMTFKEFAELWTDGELARKFPDHVRAKASADDDASRLSNYVYALIGDEPLRAFRAARGVDLVERVLEGLPPLGPTFSRASRRHVLQAVHRVLSLAVFPARVLDCQSAATWISSEGVFGEGAHLHLPGRRPEAHGVLRGAAPVAAPLRHPCARGYACFRAIAPALAKRRSRARHDPPR